MLGSPKDLQKRNYRYCGKVAKMMMMIIIFWTHLYTDVMHYLSLLYLSLLAEATFMGHMKMAGPTH